MCLSSGDEVVTPVGSVQSLQIRTMFLLKTFHLKVINMEPLFASVQVVLKQPNCIANAIFRTDLLP